MKNTIFAVLSSSILLISCGSKTTDSKTIETHSNSKKKQNVVNKTEDIRNYLRGTKWESSVVKSDGKRLIMKFSATEDEMTLENAEETDKKNICPLEGKFDIMQENDDYHLVVKDKDNLCTRTFINGERAYIPMAAVKYENNKMILGKKALNKINGDGFHFRFDRFEEIK